ncbi:hypothetical protein SAMN05216203_1002 [Marinobacter daqiaonensis]|uniref:ClpA/ClpB AAA lid domain-containing protein n=1 Tax=Marinobacter daqiaonensis TaxID=650891 RepID=A0A1I6H8N5_9GAMM|nr:hypothetical protein [Marinobacter daqiaonensis]SFR50859.1 hypothetical protein SAMN05216203_1002 [Marinobacter daqiaonensis]
MRMGQVPASGRTADPVVITDNAWYRLADDIAVALASAPRGLIWITGARGCGKTAWLQALTPSLRTDFYLLDLRHEAEVHSVREDMAGYSDYIQGTAPALILDNLSPSELMGLLAEPSHAARHIVPGHPGPILLLSPEAEEDQVAARRLERVTGRSLMRHELPASSRAQNQAILVAHRPMIEARWKVEISDEAMAFAVSGLRYRATPGQVVEWLERAAARVAVVAEEGPRECRRLRDELTTLERRIEANRERGEPFEQLEREQGILSLELTAAEIDWLERQSRGTLLQVLPEDLRAELESLTGTSDHPDLHVPSDVAGGARSAGSGNLRS